MEGPNILDNSKTSTTGLADTSELLDESINYLKTKERRGFSDDLVHHIILINIVGICTVLSIFGICTNIVNIIVLSRQGFHETVNLTLFATAISDLISLVTTLWVSICYNPLILSSNLPFLPLEVQFLTGEMPHVMAMNATSWLTAYVTFERCLCIVFPLKVKDLITLERTKVVIVLIYIMVIVTQIPTFYIHRMEWKFDVRRNQTLYGLVSPEEHMLFNAITLYLANVFGPFLSFTIVFICSLILVIKLSEKSKWRLQTKAASGKEEAISSRDRKVMKMVLAVALIFITTFTPAIVTFSFTAKDPERFPTGSLANNYFVSISFAFVFEAVNASVNIFVYYNMSSKYKAIFRSVFLGETIKL